MVLFIIDGFRKRKPDLAQDEAAGVSTKFTSAKNATNAKTSAATSMFYLQKWRPPNAMEGRLKA